MSEELEQQEGQETKKKGLGLPMILGIVGGFLLLQVAAIYLIFAVFLKPADAGSHDAGTAKGKKTEKTESVPEEEEEDEGAERKVRHILSVRCGEKEDIVINPRGTASRYVVVSVGLEVDTPEEGKEVEEHLMIPICDKITSIFSAKSLEELQDSNRRDSLRIILRKEIQPFMGEIKLRNIYFSRFLIQ